MSPAINFAGYLYLFWILILMPVMGIWSWYRLRSGKPLAPKEKRYSAMIVMQIWLLAFTYVVAHDNSVRLFSTGGPPVWGWCIAAAYMVLIAYRVKVGWRKISEERKEKARRLLPENSSHLRFWIPISLLAGLSEECAFRGLAFVLLTRLTHSQSIAILACVISFGVAHMIQGWRGVLGTGVIALIMHGLVYLTAGLYLPIAVHAVYDLIVGFIALRAFRQQGAPGLAQSQAAS